MLLRALTTCALFFVWSCTSDSGFKAGTGRNAQSGSASPIAPAQNPEQQEPRTPSPETQVTPHPDMTHIGNSQSQSTPVPPEADESISFLSKDFREALLTCDPKSSWPNLVPPQASVEAAQRLSPSQNYEIYFGYAYSSTKIILAANTCYKFSANEIEFNDSLRSVRVPPGGSMTLYEGVQQSPQPDAFRVVSTDLLFLTPWTNLEVTERPNQIGQCPRISEVCTGK